MGTTASADILCIGAGIAALACAADLQKAGFSVLLLDKGRTAGGRIATRRRDGFLADHGAQYLTVNSDRLHTLTAQWMDEGWLRIWSHGFPIWRNGEIVDATESSDFFAPPAGMNALPRRLADGLDVRSVQVTSLEYRDGLWMARDESGSIFAGKRLVLNLPPVQLLKLAAPFLDEQTVTDLNDLIYDPCWTVILRLKKDISTDWLGVHFDNHPVVRWAARDHTKRPPNAPPVLVLQATSDWSRAHLEEDAASVVSPIVAAFAHAIGEIPIIESEQAHRWRYAQPVQVLAYPSIWNGGYAIGGCGDWCCSIDQNLSCESHIERAIRSGWHLAETILQSSGKS